MRGIPHNIRTSFARLWAAREELSLRNIRPAKMKYALSYMLTLLLSNMQFQYFRLETPVGGIPGGTLMHLSLMSFSAAVMLLWRARFKPLIRVSSAIMLGTLLPFLLLPQGVPKTIFACVCWAGLGGCVSACRYGFAFAANNAERLVGVAVASFFSGVFFITKGLYLDGVFFTRVLPILLAVGSVILINLYREEDVVAIEEPTPAGRRTVYFAMAYMVAYYAIDAFAVPPAQNDGMAAFGVGYALSVVIFIVVHLLFKRGIWHVWNLFFAFAIIRGLWLVFPVPAGLEAPGHVASALLTIGIPASIYMLGGVQNRFSSVKLLKQCTIMLILVVPAATIVSGLLPADALPMTALIVSLVLCMVFMLLSPASYKYLFSANWMDDFRKPDMAAIKSKVETTDRLEDYNLTPREKEVAALLLEANTARMIAGELKLSQSTVNMHAANLYRKLNINSRAELFRKFGVPEEDGAE